MTKKRKIQLYNKWKNDEIGVAELSRLIFNDSAKRQATYRWLAFTSKLIK